MSRTNEGSSGTTGSRAGELCAYCGLRIMSDEEYEEDFRGGVKHIRCPDEEDA